VLINSSEHHEGRKRSG